MLQTQQCKTQNAKRRVKEQTSVNTSTWSHYWSRIQCFIKLALALYKLYNKDFNVIEFVHLNFNQIFTSRQTHFKILKLHNTKVGLNTLCNRLHLINDKIDLKWLNLSFDSYKVRCKRIFLV